MIRRSRQLAFLTLVALAWPAGSRAQSLEISPVLVDLDAAAPSVVVTVKNVGKGPMRYQIKGMRWNEDRSGKPTLEAADDLAIFPPLFQLAPGASRKVRVGATVPATASERAWRLMIEELPDAVAAPGQKVTIRTRFAVPAFLAPLEKKARTDLSLAVEKAGLSLVVANRGTTRVKPLTTTVSLFAQDGAPIATLDVAPWYVLAGSERAWPVKVTAEQCGAVRRVKVVAEVGGQKLEASQDFPGGVCAP